MLFGLTGVAGMTGVARARPAQQPPTLALLLERAGAHVLQLERDLPGVVAEEEYRQESSERQFSGAFIRKHRDLRSDVLLVLPEAADRFVLFRDVFQVDGKPVRDRDDRLARLFLNPALSRSGQLQKIREESARYNLGDISRDFNVPVLALTFLHPEHQPRFTFTVSQTGAAGQPWEIEYREARSQTFIRTEGGSDLPVRGRFRIEPASGRVWMSELVTEDNILRANVTVTYQMDRVLGFLVPIEMRESIGTQSGRLEITGKATYSRFRKFRVTIAESIGPIRR